MSQPILGSRAGERCSTPWPSCHRAPSATCSRATCRTPASGKLGSNPRPQTILARKGDAERGEELFWSQRVQCQTCHKIDGKGTEVGPDLSAIGKTRTRTSCSKACWSRRGGSSRSIQPYLVRTLDGRSFTGLLVRRDAKEVVLKTLRTRRLRVAVDDLETVQPARDSLMPTGALADLTAQQAADLLEYLATRK